MYSVFQMSIEVVGLMKTMVVIGVHTWWSLICCKPHHSKNK